MREKKVVSESLLLFTLAGIQFSHILDFMIMMPLGPQLMSLFNITPTQFGFLVSSYTFSASISGFIAVFFADKFDRKRYLLISYLGFSLGTAICAFANSYILLAFGRIIAGLFGGLLGGCIYSIVGDLVPTQRRGNAMGIIMSAFSISSVAGVPIGLYLANIYNWHAPFFLVLGFALILFVLSLFFLPNIDDHVNAYEKPSIKKYLATLFEPNHFYSLLLTIFVVHGSFTLIPYISAYLVKNVGIPITDIPYIYLLGGGFTLFTARIIGKLTDKYNPAYVFTILSIIAIVPIYSLTNHGVAPIKIVLITSVPFMIFISGRTVPLMSIVTRASNDKTRGAFMSMFTGFRHVATSSASFIGGSIIGEAANGSLTNYNKVGYFSIVSILLSLFVMSILYKKVQEKESNG